MSTPQTTIYICSGVRLNSRYEHSIYFASQSAQEEYFRGKVVKTLPAYSFIRRSWALKVEAKYVDALKWNYLYFRYPEDNKNYYFFINKVEYVNDSTVELSLELDLLQTYRDTFYFGECFIEREHVRDDTRGLHVLDEGLATGDYIKASFNSMGEWYDDMTDSEYGELGDFSIVLLSTLHPEQLRVDDDESSAASTLGGLYGNVYSGVGLFAVELKDQKFLTDAINLKPLLSEAIVAMWMYPTQLLEFAGEQEGSELWCKNVVGTKTLTYTVNIPDTLGSYVPKNNKLLTSPYTMHMVSNKNGGKMTLRYEDFSDDNDMVFHMYGGLSPTASARLIPANYGNVKHYTAQRDNDEYGLSLPAFPTCAWNSDTYKIWLAKNEESQSAELRSGVLSSVGSLVSLAVGMAGLAAAPATGGASTAMTIGSVGAIGSGSIKFASSLNSINATLGKEETAAKLPDKTCGSYSAAISMANYKHNFESGQLCIKPERAKIIDDFFTMYGYRVNRVGIPRLHNRELFTYVKTQGCHVYGDIPNEDIVKIEAIFDKGVTYWTSGDSIGNYNSDNNTL